jgi:hypothetical protein
MLGADRQGPLCELASLRDDSHAVRYPDDDPVLMTLIHDIDIAQWVTGSDFHSIVARRSEASATDR